MSENVFNFMFQKNPQGKLQEQERKIYRDLFDKTPDLLFVLSGAEHTIEMTNRSMNDLLGFDAIHKKFDQVMPDAHDLRRALQEVYFTNNPVELKKSKMHIQNTIKYFHWVISPRLSRKGKIEGLLLLGQDVTTQVLVEILAGCQKESYDLVLKRRPLTTLFQYFLSQITQQLCWARGSGVWLYDHNCDKFYKTASRAISDAFSQALSQPLYEDESHILSQLLKTQNKLFFRMNSDLEQLKIFKNTVEYESMKSCLLLPISTSLNKGLAGVLVIWSPEDLALNKKEDLDLLSSLLLIMSHALEKWRVLEHFENAKVRAEMANAAKSSFLASISHEIRTPLGVVLGFSQLLKEADLSFSQRTRYLDTIERNVRLLLSLVDDLLDLSKIEAGKMSIELIDFSFPELLTDLFSSFRLRAEEKQIRLNFKMKTEIPRTMRSDPVRVRQILTNALSNAIKFTSKGEVNLLISFDGDILEFEIIDTGCGISSENQKNLFQSYKQANSSIGRKYGGTGLGLVLTRKLCAALGGDFWLQKSEPGVGSVFMAQIKAEEGETSDAQLRFEMDLTSLPPQGPKEILKGKNILLVDDSKDNQDLFSIYLKEQKARITVASNGAQAIEKASHEEFDLILMDIQMPEVDGITAVQTLRQKGYQKPILALTAHAMKEEREKCIKTGFDDFLAKPLSYDELMRKIVSYI